jgi:hypothetical protein
MQSGTARITIAEDKAPEDGASSAPAADAAKEAAPQAPAAAMPAEGGAGPISIKARPVSKRDTSRIPLSAAMGEANGERKAPAVAAPAAPAAPAGLSGQRPATIRIKPSGAPSLRMGSPAAKTAATVGSRLTADQKRKTSRIALDAVMAAPASGPSKPGAPKTIRLKRPADVATVRVADPSAASADAAPSAADASRKTSPVEAETAAGTGEAASTGSPTRRKTIRVRRPGGAGSSRRMSVSRSSSVAAGKPAGGPAAAAAPGAGAPAAEADQPGGFFAVCAIAAILVCAVAIYMLCAQVFGPNACLTEVSYGMPEMDLSWPGKIMPKQ